MTHPSMGPRPVETARSEQVRRDARWADLERLRSSNPMLDAVIDEVQGRRIRVGEHWLSDFASSSYLGFDQDPEIIDSVVRQLGRWGTHAGRSRLIGSPRLFTQIEEELAALIGAPDTLVLPSVTDIHTSVIPLFAGRGQVFVDAMAHQAIYDGCSVATSQGASLHRFRPNDAEHLEELLQAAPADSSKLVCIHGVNRLTGNVANVAAFAAVAREHNARLYVDDGDGFGVVGERSPDELTPYGISGNGALRHAGEDYDHVVVVGSFANGYSSPLSFLALPTHLKSYLKVTATPYLYSGPASTAALAGVLAGFTVNRSRGEQIRLGLFQKTQRVLSRLAELRVHTTNTDGLPIIELPVVHPTDLHEVGTHLFERGIWATLAAYPLVPRSHVGVRIQVTAAHTEGDVDLLGEVLGEVVGRFSLSPAARDNS